VRRWLAAAALLLALAGLAAGCSIPTQSDPNSIPASKVPSHLLDPHLPTTTTTQPKSLVAVQVYFINSLTQLLQSEQRYVPFPAPLASVINQLLQGPAADETPGVRTAIPNDVTLNSVDTAPGNVVVVNLNSAFLQTIGTDAELAVGQIVATVAAAKGTGTGVVFEIDGQRVPVLIANGTEVSGPVYLIQFLSSSSPA